MKIYAQKSIRRQSHHTKKEPVCQKSKTKLKTAKNKNS